MMYYYQGKIGKNQGNTLSIICKIITSFLIVLLMACSGSDATQPLKIGTNIWPGYEPLYLARELGYYESDKIQLVELTSASQVLRAFQNDLLDAAALTLDEAINLQASGEKLSILLVTDVSDGGDALVGRAEFKTIEQLKSARIGVEHTALGAFFISRMVEMTSLDKNDITIVPLEVNLHERAFKEGTVDAVVTFDPVRSRLIGSGGNVLFDSRQIPGEIVDVLVVKQDRMKNYSQNIEHLKDGWFRALNEMNNNPAGSYEIIARRLKLDVDEINNVYKLLKLPNRQQNNKMLYARPVADLYPVAEKLRKIMSDNRLIQGEVDIKALFEHSQVEE